MRVLCNDQRLLPGAGAVELELCKRFARLQAPKYPTWKMSNTHFDSAGVFVHPCSLRRTFNPYPLLVPITTCRLSAFADEVQGLDQYAIRKFGEAFDVVPRTLAENSGGDPTTSMHTLHGSHLAAGTGNSYFLP